MYCIFSTVSLELIQQSSSRSSIYAACDETIFHALPHSTERAEQRMGPSGTPPSSTKHSYRVTAWSLLTEVAFEPKKVAGRVPQSITAERTKEAK